MTKNKKTSWTPAPYIQSSPPQGVPRHECRAQLPRRTPSFTQDPSLTVKIPTPTLVVANVLLIVMSASLRGNRRSPERNYHASARSLTVTKTERSR